MTRTRAAFLNYSSGLLLTCGMMLTGLFATPLLLRWLGTERFGAFRAASDCGGYLALLQFGYNTALTPVLAEALNRRDEPAVRSALAMGFRAFAKFAVLTAAAGVLLALFITHIVHVSPGDTADLRRGFLIGLIGTLAVVLTPLRTLADVGQEGWVVNFSLLTQSVVITSLTLLLAWSGWGITGQFVGSLGGLTVFQTILAKRAYQRIPNLGRIIRTTPDSPTLRSRLRSMSRWAFFLQLSFTASYLADNVVIAFIMGAAMVTPFFITQRMINIVQGQLQGLSGATWAGLTELYHRGEHQVLKDRYAELLQLVVVTGFCVLIPVAALNHAFMSIWLPRVPYGGEWITILASANAILFGISSLWVQMLDGAGFLKQYAHLSLISGVLNLGLSVVATSRVGIIGPLLGSFLTYMLVTMWAYPLELRRAFGIEPRTTVLSIVRPLPILALLAVVVWWLAHHYPPNHWATLALAEFLYFSVCATVTWRFLLTATQRALWQNRFRGIARRRPAATSVPTAVLDTISEPNRL